MATLFETIKSALTGKTPATAARLGELLDEAEVRLSTARARAAEARSSSPAAALDDSAWVKRQAGIAAADAEVERLDLVAGQLREGRDAALMREDQDARQARYDDARAARDAASREIVTRYPKLAAGIVALLRASADADILVAGANAALPDGAQLLDTVEVEARTTPGQSREVLRETRVELWAYAATGEPAPEALQLQVQVEQASGRGFVHAAVGGAVIYFTRRTFIRREVREATPARWASSLASIVLHGLRGGDPAFYEPANALGIVSGPHEVLATIDGLEAERRTPAARIERPVRVELIPVTDAEQETSNV